MREAFRKRRGQPVVGSASNGGKLIVLQDLRVRLTAGRAWLGRVEGSHERVDWDGRVLNIVGFLVLLNVHIAIVLVPHFDRQIASYFPGNAETALNRILRLEVVRDGVEDTVLLGRPWRYDRDTRRGKLRRVQCRIRILECREALFDCCSGQQLRWLAGESLQCQTGVLPIGTQLIEVERHEKNYRSDEQTASRAHNRLSVALGIPGKP